MSKHLPPGHLEEEVGGWCLAAGNNSWPMKNNCSSCSRGAGKLAAYVIVYISQSEQACKAYPRPELGTKLVMQTGQTTCRCGQLGTFKRRRKEFTVVGLMNIDALGHRGQFFVVVQIQTIFRLHA